MMTPLKDHGHGCRRGTGELSCAEVEFLGYGDTVRESAGAHCADRQQLGAKFKLTEAAMFGTPFFAPVAAISGCPTLPEAEIIDLAKSDSAANQIAKALRPRRLAAYHLAIQDSHVAYGACPEGRWSSIPASAIARFG